MNANFCLSIVLSKVGFSKKRVGAIRRNWRRDDEDQSMDFNDSRGYDIPGSTQTHIMQ